MTTWYSASLGDIKEIEVERETIDYVTTNGFRIKKTSDWQWIRKTKEEAKLAMVNEYQREFDEASQRLARMFERLERAKAL